MNDFERIATSRGGGGNAITLFLGLFLLVLAFFILLVSISTIENVKSKEVMNSLTSTFSDLVTPVTDPTDFVSMQGEILSPEVFQDRIAGVFSANVAVDHIRVIQPGRVMRIDLQALELFVDGSANIRPGHIDLIDRIVASLSANPKGIRYEMAFLIGSTMPDSIDLPTSQTLEISRAGNFARILIERGAPPNAISVGIRDGAATDVTIHFYTRDEDLARLNFGKEESAKKEITYDNETPVSSPGSSSISSTIIKLAPIESDPMAKPGRKEP